MDDNDLDIDCSECSISISDQNQESGYISEKYMHDTVSDIHEDEPLICMKCFAIKEYEDSLTPCGRGFQMMIDSLYEDMKDIF